MERRTSNRRNSRKRKGSRNNNGKGNGKRRTSNRESRNNGNGNSRKNRRESRNHERFPRDQRMQRTSFLLESESIIKYN
jgi:hypothetical protein